MAEVDPSRLPDGATVRRLPSGLLVVRRKKHEWNDGLGKLPDEKLAIRTNKSWGSKFLPRWTTARIADWTAEQIEAAGWTLDAQEPNPLEIRMAEDVGLVEGRLVRTIQVRCDGRHAHAYPVKD